MQLCTDQSGEVQWNAVLYGTFQINPGYFSVVQSGEVKRNLRQSSLVKCSAVQSSPVHFSVVQPSAVQFIAVQCSPFIRVRSRSVQTSPVQSSTVQCISIRNSLGPLQPTADEFSLVKYRAVQSVTAQSSPVHSRTANRCRDERIALRLSRVT